MTARAEPGYFGPEDRSLFGWLHRVPADAPARFGVVLCNPFGFEAVSAHRSMRHVAAALQARGIPALRFDYDGSGDSAGSEHDPDRVASWLRSIDHAADFLRRSAGVQDLCLWGVRLGGLLAAIAAQRRRDVFALVAVAPVISGRRMLREMRALAGASAPAGDLEEAAGSFTSSQTRDDLGKLDLGGAPSPAPHVLLLQRDDLPIPDAWLQTLRANDVDAREQTFSGYAEMMLDAHEAVVPQALSTATVDWLLSLPRGTAPAHAAASAPPDLRETMSLARQQTGLRLDICETAQWLDDAAGTFGIVARSAQPGPRARGSERQLLLLLNSGAVHRIGPSRLYVDSARALAARGMTVARIDLAGLGDSPAKAGEAENQTYPPAAVAVVQAALRGLVQQYDIADVHIAGICSGAFHALTVAIAGERLRSAVIINPLIYYWKPGTSLAMPEHLATAEAQRYQRSALRVSSWFKLLRGQVNIVAAGNIMRRRLQGLLLHGLRQVGRDLRLPIANDLGADLRRIADRRTRLLFIFSESDPGLSMLFEQGGRVVAQLSRRGSVQIDIVPQADHTFTTHAARGQLLDLIVSHFARYLRRARS